MRLTTPGPAGGVGAPGAGLAVAALGVLDSDPSGGGAGAPRRARAWYSGPCFRGSAYSRGFSVQYVPDDGPYQLAPPQSGSRPSPASS